LLEGEQWAADLLRKAGVDTRWLACSAGEGLHGEAECARPQTLLDLSLNLVKSAKSKDFRLVDNAYGFAAPSTDKEFGRDAWVFDDLVKKSASELQLSSAHLLGTVIAHELGHLLLGPNAHSKWGLMCARWSHEVLLAADRGDLNFSNPERAKIQNFVIANHQAQISDLAQLDATSSKANNEIPSELRDSFLSK
jgi:hypothetical protein